MKDNCLAIKEALGVLPETGVQKLISANSFSELELKISHFTDQGWSVVPGSIGFNVASWRGTNDAVHAMRKAWAVVSFCVKPNQNDEPEKIDTRKPV